MGAETNAAGVPACPDRQGFALREVPSKPRFAARTVRRRWVWGIVAVCVILALIGSYYLVRRTAVRSLWNSCREAVRDQDWQRLGSLAERWRRWEPGKAAPWIYLAEAASQTGQYERAVELLDHLPDGDPMTPPALVERSAMLFAELNRPIEAAETLERALELDPTLLEARRRLIFYYAYTLQRRKMVEHAYDAIWNDCDLPETYVYLMLQDALLFDNAYDVNTKWFSGNRDEELFLVARAIHRIRSRGLDETEDPREGPRGEDGTPFHRQVVAEYFQRFPQNLELLNYYLHLATAAGEIDEVARLLSQAPPTSADDSRFWRYKGWLQAAKGELEEARQCYQKALSLNPYDYVAQHQLAGVERRFRQLDRVKELEELSSETKSLQRDLSLLERVDKVPPGLLKRMAEHARKCGDYPVAAKLLLRVEQWSAVWSQMRASPAPL
jgi:tetratricopeptide (TPR) repeat protein